MIRKRKRTAAFIIAAAMAVSCLPAAGYAEEVAPDNPADISEDIPENVSEDISAAVSGETGIDPAIAEKVIGEEGEHDGYICVLKEDASDGQIDRIEKSVNAIDDPGVAEEITEGESFQAESLEVIQEIADPSAIDFIEPDYKVHACFEEDPYDYRNATAHKTIGIRSVWDAGVRGAGRGGVDTPVVAVVDTGVAGWNRKALRHEDLDYDRFPYAMKSGIFSDYDDHNGHGTFVIGEIIATMGNDTGVTGLMPKVKVVPVKVLDKNGSGRVSDCIHALNALIQDGNIDVVNMSLGTPKYSAAFAKSCKRAAAKGMIVVAAAGNNGNRVFAYPAGFDGVIGVAAVRAGGGIYRDSEFNDSVDCAAPGVNIAGLYGLDPNYYIESSGTSMAAPMVSALAAMVKSIDPSINHNKFARILANTSKDKGKRGYDIRYGNGIINFAKAYSYVTKNKGRIKAPRILKKQRPKRTKITRLKAGKKSVRVRLKRARKATSYQVAIKVRGGKYRIMRFSSRKFTIKGLKRHKKYYIKARSVRNVNGIYKYGKWSKKKKFRTK